MSKVAQKLHASLIGSGLNANTITITLQLALSLYDLELTFCIALLFVIEW